MRIAMHKRLQKPKRPPRRRFHFTATMEDFERWLPVINGPGFHGNAAAFFRAGADDLVKRVGKVLTWPRTEGR